MEELDKTFNMLNEVCSTKLIKIKSDLKVYLQIYIQRFSQLVFLKSGHMEEVLEKIERSTKDNFFKSLDEEGFQEIRNLKKDLENIDKQKLESEKELEKWRKEARILENMLRKPNFFAENLSEINSDVISNNDHTVNIILINI